MDGFQHAGELHHKSAPLGERDIALPALLEGSQGLLAQLDGPQFVALDILGAGLRGCGVLEHVVMSILYICEGGTPRCSIPLRLCHAVLYRAPLAGVALSGLRALYRSENISGTR